MLKKVSRLKWPWLGKQKRTNIKGVAQIALAIKKKKKTENLEKPGQSKVEIDIPCLEL